MHNGSSVIPLTKRSGSVAEQVWIRTQRRKDAKVRRHQKMGESVLFHLRARRPAPYTAGQAKGAAR